MSITFRNKITVSFIIAILLTNITLLSSGNSIRPVQDDRFISYIADPKKQSIKLYFKDDQKQRFGSILHLKEWLDKKSSKLILATNGGMYNTDNHPLGLYIEHQHEIAHLNTASGNGNFHLKPNGLFYITTKKEAGIITTDEFKNNDNIDFATQSGPMLIINGEIHPAFKKGSENTNIRNGVGILPDNRVIFVISAVPVNFYDFASFFKSKGCKNALYLDGFVSRMYLPEKKWMQMDGDFGVMIGVTNY